MNARKALTMLVALTIGGLAVGGSAAQAAATVGKPGVNGDGCALVMASAFSLPDFTCPSDEVVVAKIIFTWSLCSNVSRWADGDSLNVTSV